MGGEKSGGQLAWCDAGRISKDGESASIKKERDLPADLKKKIRRKGCWSYLKILFYLSL